MPLDRIRQVGDVILVDSADSLVENFNPERFSKVINWQVITESGSQLGRVLGFSFDVETGELTTLVIGALGVPLLGEGVLSTWEMPVGEIVSSGTDRIIVYEGAEEKLKQLGTGLLEKLGIGGGGSWEQEERERFRMGAVPAENQLPAGQPTAQEQRRIQPASSRAFQPAGELEYVELEERQERQPLRQRRYLDEESDEAGGRFRPTERSAERSADRSATGPDRASEEERGDDRLDRSSRAGSRAGSREDRDVGRDEERAYERRYGRDYDPEPRPERNDDREYRGERQARTEPERRLLVDVEPEVIDDPW
jgi:sporulation protein YlmC with PRC-barrel domain